MAAYCIVNDVSERAFQMEHGGTTTKGKSADSFGPVGPWLVTADEIPDPQVLEMWTTVNGERRQHGNTAKMIFTVASLVAYVSRFMSLRAGDLISTGTPAGVGHGSEAAALPAAGRRGRARHQQAGRAAPSDRGSEVMRAHDVRRAAFVALAVLGLWAGLIGAPVEAAEIKVLSTVGMQPATVELFKSFEAATGHKILVTYGLAAVLRTSVLEGASADVLVLTSATIDDLVKGGRVVAATKTDVARSGVGVGIKAGAPKPDIGTPEALKRTLVAAKSIGYSREGASGVAFARAVERLGLAEQVAAKYKDTGTKAGEMVAAGEIELAAAQIPELMAVPGVEVVGPLPAELQTTTIFSVGLATEARDAGASRALIEFLAGPQAAPVYKAKGLGG